MTLLSRLARGYYVDNILAILLSVTRAAGRDVHPEFIRAIISVAQAFGISETELKNGKLEG